MSNPYQKQLAFTMAEAILVMTILGIIATVVITNLKLFQFRDKGLEVQSTKVINEIDNAIQAMLGDYSFDGKMDKLIDPNDRATVFSFEEDYSKSKKLLSKYLSLSRKKYTIGEGNLEKFDQVLTNSPTAYSQSKEFYLKDGTLIFLGAAEKYGIQPNQTGTVNIEGCETSKSLLGLILIDINGLDEPNITYKDQFYLPINYDGIDYEQLCKAPQENTAAPEYDCEAEYRFQQYEFGCICTRDEMIERGWEGVYINGRLEYCRHPACNLECEFGLSAEYEY